MNFPTTFHNVKEDEVCPTCETLPCYCTALMWNMIGFSRLTGALSVGSSGSKSVSSSSL